MNQQNDLHTFAFLVHPRDNEDFFRKYPITRYMPEAVLSRITSRLPPVVVTRVTGVKTRQGTPVLGYIIAIPMTASQMLKDRTYAQKRIIRALKKAQKLGATHAGLGAFTSVVTDGGTALKGAIPGMHLTNGNALTAYMSFLGLKEAIAYRKIPQPVVSIVGATGSIGSAVAHQLAKDESFSKLYVVGRTPSNIEKLLDRLKRHSSFSRIEKASLENAIPKSDIVLMATSSDSVVLESETLKTNALIYDITQPKNIPKDISRKRPDITILDGGLVKLPRGVRYAFNLGIPKNTVYSCLAETMLLAAAQYPDDFCLGHVTNEHVSYIEGLASEFKYGLASPTHWGNVNKS